MNDTNFSSELIYLFILLMYYACKTRTRGKRKGRKLRADGMMMIHEDDIALT